MKHVLPLRLVALMILLVALAAPGLALADSPQQAVSQVTLDLNEFMITPMSFTVTQGQAIQITAKNTGKFPHNVAFQLGSVNTTIFPANLTAGQTQTTSFTFPTAGQWRMYCPVDSHAQRGMVGTVTVMAANATALPATGGGGLAKLELGGLALVALALAGLGVAGRRRLGGMRGR